jgi:hypothetical protein
MHLVSAATEKEPAQTDLFIMKYVAQARAHQTLRQRALSIGGN